MPFLLVTAAIVEIGLVALSNATLKNGVREASRLTKVGQGGCTDPAAIVGHICANSGFLPDCSARMSIERVQFSSFSSGMQQAADDRGGAYDAVGGGDVVVMRATYDWQIVNPMLTPFMGEGDGSYSFQQSFAFKNELFENQSCQAVQPTT